MKCCMIVHFSPALYRYIKGQKRQWFGVMHLKGFTHANHLQLQSKLSH